MNRYCIGSQTVASSIALTPEYQTDKKNANGFPMIFEILKAVLYLFIPGFAIASFLIVYSRKPSLFLLAVSLGLSPHLSSLFLFYSLLLMPGKSALFYFLLYTLFLSAISIPLFLPKNKQVLAASIETVARDFRFLRRCLQRLTFYSLRMLDKRIQISGFFILLAIYFHFFERITPTKAAALLIGYPFFSSNLVKFFDQARSRWISHIIMAAILSVLGWHIPQTIIILCVMWFFIYPITRSAFAWRGLFIAFLGLCLGALATVTLHHLKFEAEHLLWGSIDNFEYASFGKFVSITKTVNQIQILDENFVFIKNFLHAPSLSLQMTWDFFLNNLFKTSNFYIYKNIGVFFGFLIFLLMFNIFWRQKMFLIFSSLTLIMTTLFLFSFFSMEIDLYRIFPLFVWAYLLSKYRTLSNFEVHLLSFTAGLSAFAHSIGALIMFSFPVIIFLIEPERPKIWNLRLSSIVIFLISGFGYYLHEIVWGSGWVLNIF